MTKRRTLAGLPTLILAVMMLVACSTGTSNEANRGKQVDAERTSVISDMQATRTWEIMNSTPESTPEETPAP